MNQQLKEFLEKYLKLQIEDIHLFDNGINNVTGKVTTKDGKVFVVQVMRRLHNPFQVDLINDALDYIAQASLPIQFASKVFDKRFYYYNDSFYHIMSDIEGQEIHLQSVTREIIINTAKALAFYHKGLEGFDVSKYIFHDKSKDIAYKRNCTIKYFPDSEISDMKELYKSFMDKSENLHPNPKLPKTVIHGDPAFKNFIVDDKGNIVGLIDYELMAINDSLWDLCDLIRSYMKCEIFTEKIFKEVIHEYNTIRQLTKEEKSSLEAYCKMMILNTGFMYFNTLYHDSGSVLFGRKDACISGAKRCLSEFDKLHSFFH